MNLFKRNCFNCQKKNEKNATQCNCMPSCTSITYDYEISQQDWNIEDLYKARNKTMPSFFAIVFTKIKILFKEAKISTTERSELYGFHDFMADCGGLLGLFMGVSILSVIELIYYFTLRLVCNLGCRKKATSN